MEAKEPGAALHLHSGTKPRHHTRLPGGFEQRGSSPPKPLASALINMDLVVTDVTATACFEKELRAMVNRSKGNQTEFSRAELIQKSSYCRVSGRDMDLLELSAYGNVRRGQDSGGCRIQ
ncbi:hypothetical protein ACFX2H_015445 [Malus domestica]